MTGSRRSLGPVYTVGLLVVAIIAATLHGAQGEEADADAVPSEVQCRPYIEKALKDLGTGPPEHGSAEDGTVSEEDNPQETGERGIQSQESQEAVDDTTEDADEPDTVVPDNDATSAEDRKDASNETQDDERDDDSGRNAEQDESDTTDSRDADQEADQEDEPKSDSPEDQTRGSNEAAEALEDEDSVERAESADEGDENDTVIDESPENQDRSEEATGSGEDKDETVEDETGVNDSKVEDDSGEDDATNEEANGSEDAEITGDGKSAEDENSAEANVADDGHESEQRDEGASGEDQEEGTSMEAQEEGASMEAQEEGASAEAQDDGASAEAQDDGASAEAQDDGASAEAQDDGASAEAQEDGASAEAQDEGASTEADKDSVEATEQDSVERSKETGSREDVVINAPAESTEDKDGSQETDTEDSKEAETEEASRNTEHTAVEASNEESHDAQDSSRVKRDTADDSGEEQGEKANGDSKEGGEESEESSRTPEEDLIEEIEIPENLRPRDHINQLLRLDVENEEKERAIQKAAEVVLKDLKKLYDTAIQPLETLYKYRDLSNRHFGDPEIFSKPLVLFMGPWSGGKSSIINYLLDNEYTAHALRTGAEPSPAYFNIVMHGDETEVLDGTQLAADWTFSGLQKFGQGMLDRLRGLKINSKLLERVNIVEIPGILEIRKQVQRLFPFNDACQWFIDRADIIFLVYDPAKLDVGPETEAILDQLKGREYQTRIILNKADQVKPEELMRVQGALIWNISPLMSSAEPPIMYSTSLWSMPYEAGAPTRLLYAQERAFLRDLRTAIDKRVEHKIASARRFAVRVRNHAKMVDCYLTTYYNHKTFFGNKKEISDKIIENPQDYHIYEGLSTLTNISRYDLPDPDVYRDFFRLNALYEFQPLSSTCTYFRGCPINRLDVAIAYDLPELVGTYKKMVEAAMHENDEKAAS